MYDILDLYEEPYDPKRPIINLVSLGYLPAICKRKAYILKIHFFIMGFRETRVKDTIHKDRKVAKSPLSEKEISRSRNLIRKGKFEAISITIAVLTLFFVIFGYYENRMPELIYTEESANSVNSLSEFL